MIRIACENAALKLDCVQVSNMVSRELEKECIVVFDEAHNIDNVCIEVKFFLPSLPSALTTWAVFCILFGRTGLSSSTLISYLASGRGMLLDSHTSADSTLMLIYLPGCEPLAFYW